MIAGFTTNLFSSVDLVNAYAAGIAVDFQEALRPVIELNPDVVDVAQTLDNERIHNETRGPLHGAPVLLKENIGTKDNMNTTAGPYALFGSTILEDFTVASNLRQAGAVILGKAGLSEWAVWRGEENSDGWSARDGQVKGAYYYV